MDSVEKKYPDEVNNIIEINQEKLIIDTDFFHEEKLSIASESSFIAENAKSIIKEKNESVTLSNKNFFNQQNLEEYSDEHFSIRRVIKNMDSEIIF